MKTKNRVQHIILVVFMILLCYPLVEFFTPLNISGKLTRAGHASNLKPLKVRTWTQGTFQESFMNYMNDKIGLFPFFVRLHNQLEYSLFGNIHTSGVITGKENYLYERAYLDTYFGKDFMGLDTLQRFSMRMKNLQDTLESMDKFLMIALATGKASYYPEYIPYSEPRDSTNIEFLLKEFDRLGVNHLNFTPWFLEMKDTLGYLLFPQYGIHWSHYSTVLATDSLVKYIESETGWDLPNLTITARDSSPVTRYFDNDISNSMNLFRSLQPQPMVYPEFEWEKPKKTKKKLLVIGDSFFWDLLDNVNIKEGFEDVQFWYYNQTVVEKSRQEGRDDSQLPYLTRHLDLMEVIEEYDAFMIIANEPNLIHRGWGFPEDALKTLQDSTYVPRERQNPLLMAQFIKNPHFQAALSKMAAERGITLEEMENIYMHDRNFKIE